MSRSATPPFTADPHLSSAAADRGDIQTAEPVHRRFNAPDPIIIRIETIMSRSTDLLTAARAEALFTAHLPDAGRQPPRAEVQAATRCTVPLPGGPPGCAAEMAPP